MLLSRSDTIVAVASGQGRAGICVLRLSGPAAAAAVSRCAGGLPPARRASLRRLRDPATGETLDHALVLWFPAPASFTGEDQAELHLHGGLAVRSAVLRVVLDVPGCRAAEPGEFTRRAFANGRLDLTAVEGLADLIAAETEMQRRQAQRQMDGALARQVTAWRDRLIGALALHEAALDFADEGDVPAGVAASALADIAHLTDEVDTALAGAARGERLRDGFTVVIAGPPNAGKSTLMNAIARRDVAIVSPVPGTTRDAIEVRCDLDGWPVTFVDTAGLRETEDSVERQGIARTRARMDAADLVLALHSLEHGAGASPIDEALGGSPLLRVGTKLDLVPAYAEAPAPGCVLAVSVATGEGLAALLAEIRARAEGALASGPDAALTRARHRQVLGEVQAALRRALAVAPSGATELVAEDLRLALRALGRMTGQVDVEEVLDRIFSSFCIGK